MRRLLFLLLAPAACREHHDLAPTASHPVAVYQAAVDSMVPQDPRALHGWLADSTHPLAATMGEHDDWFLGQAPSDYREALRALLADTLPQVPLPRSLELPHEIRWAAATDEADPLDTHFELSKIGFNVDSSRAVLIRSYYCGALCAGIGIELYERIGAASWRRTGIIPVLAS